MKNLFLAAAVVLCATTVAHARLGETEGQSQLRYGQPREDLKGPGDQPLIVGAVEKAYEFQGWRVRAAFVGGLCHAIEYAHIPVDGQVKQIGEAEMKAIMDAEKGKFSWREEKSKTPPILKDLEKGLKQAFKVNKWERTDRATAELKLGLLLVFKTKDADDLEKKLSKTPAAQPKNLPKF